MVGSHWLIGMGINLNQSPSENLPGLGFMSQELYNFQVTWMHWGQCLTPPGSDMSTLGGGGATCLYHFQMVSSTLEVAPGSPVTGPNQFSSDMVFGMGIQFRDIVQGLPDHVPWTEPGFLSLWPYLLFVLLYLFIFLKC